jgi:hypothetical protein
MSKSDAVLFCIVQTVGYGRLGTCKKWLLLPGLAVHIAPCLQKGVNPHDSIADQINIYDAKKPRMARTAAGGDDGFAVPRTSGIAALGRDD